MGMEDIHSAGSSQSVDGEVPSPTLNRSDMHHQQGEEGDNIQQQQKDRLKSIEEKKNDPMSSPLLVKYADFHTAVSPKDTNQLYELGMTLSKMESVSSWFLAEQMFLRSLKGNPNNEVCINAYSQFLVQTNPQAATAVYTESMERSPWKALLFFSFAVFSADVLMNLEQAEKYFLKAIEIDPKPFMLKTFGLFLKIVRGQNGRAQEILERYHRTKDTYKPPPHYYRKLSLDTNITQPTDNGKLQLSKSTTSINPGSYPTSPTKKRHPSRSFSF